MSSNMSSALERTRPHWDSGDITTATSVGLDADAFCCGA
jgi:hypothetical protein